MNRIVHSGERAQHDLLQIKLRDSLVRARMAVINFVRFTLRSLGYRVSIHSSERFHKLLVDEVSESVRSLVAHGVASIGERMPYQRAGDLHRPAGLEIKLRGNAIRVRDGVVQGAKTQ